MAHISDFWTNCSIWLTSLFSRSKIHVDDPWFHFYRLYGNNQSAGSIFRLNSIHAWSWVQILDQKGNPWCMLLFTGHTVLLGQTFVDHIPRMGLNPAPNLTKEQFWFGQSLPRVMKIVRWLPNWSDEQNTIHLGYANIRRTILCPRHVTFHPP